MERTMTVEINALAAVADALNNLTYGEMMELAQSLTDMRNDSAVDLDRPEEWASLLNSWAENYNPAA